MAILNNLTEQELLNLAVWISDFETGAQAIQEINNELTERILTLKTENENVKNQLKGARFKCSQCGKYKCTTVDQVSCMDCMPF